MGKYLSHKDNNLSTDLKQKDFIHFFVAPKDRVSFFGEVSEWLKEHAWKVCIPERVSRVRIPPSPHYTGFLEEYFLRYSMGDKSVTLLKTFLKASTST